MISTAKPPSAWPKPSLQEKCTFSPRSSFQTLRLTHRQPSLVFKLSWIYISERLQELPQPSKAAAPWHSSRCHNFPATWLRHKCWIKKAVAWQQQPPICQLGKFPRFSRGRSENLLRYGRFWLGDAEHSVLRMSPQRPPGIYQPGSWPKALQPLLYPKVQLVSHVPGKGVEIPKTLKLLDCGTGIPLMQANRTRTAGRA